MPEAGFRRRAIFLDRDGTLAEEVGYTNHISRFHVYPFAAAAVRRFNQAGFAVIVVTNQSGVARGFFPESFVHLVHEKMTAELAAEGARIDGIYFCPHNGDEGCRCRKPRPGMVERAAAEHNLELAGSYLVSDRFADLEMARPAGCRSVLVLTGYGRGELQWNRARWPDLPDLIAEDLAQAAELILKEAR